MKNRLFVSLLLALLTSATGATGAAQARSYISYISDSPSSSVVVWVAKEAGIFKKHGLDLDTIFIDGSVRGIQSLIAGDLGYSGAVGGLERDLGSTSAHRPESIQGQSGRFCRSSFCR